MNPTVTRNCNENGNENGNKVRGIGRDLFSYPTALMQSHESLLVLLHNKKLYKKASQRQSEFIL